MNLIVLTGVFIFTFATKASAQPPVKKALPYLNQSAPGLTPKIFAPALVSLSNQYEFGSVFSKDGNEFYYAVDSGGKAEIYFMQLKGNEWTRPVKIIADEKYSHNDPFLSPDESKLFFISDRPMNGTSEKKDYDIWYVERKNGHWSNPVNAGIEINSERNEYYISFSKKGSMYFSSNANAPGDKKNDYDIYSSKNINGRFQQKERLNDSVNADGYDADVFVAQDESYLIFCANRPEGLGEGDLYISFRKKDGGWTKAKNMGKPINTPGHELCPFVSGDGKYFFYTSNKDIYWVDAKIIDKLR